MQVIVDNLAAAYYRSGSGPVMVMLHGWGDTSDTFLPLLHVLEKKFTVIRIDLAGFGGSQTPEAGWSLHEYAVFVRNVLQKIAVSPQDITVLVGHSNGGAIAITALSEGLLGAKRLILIASSGIRTTQKTAKSAKKVTAKIGKLASMFLPASKKQKLRQAYYQKIGSDMLVAPHMEATFKKIIKEDVLERSQKIAVPTLLIYGELDTAAPPLFGQMFQQAINGSELRVAQGADHFLHQQHSEKVIAYMKAFLS